MTSLPGIKPDHYKNVRKMKDGFVVRQNNYIKLRFILKNM